MVETPTPTDTPSIVERLESRIASGDTGLAADAKAEIERLQARVRDYEEWHADQKRLVRELDIALNGEDGAAPQASLCDIVAQVTSGGYIATGRA